MSEKQLIAFTIITIISRILLVFSSRRSFFRIKKETLYEWIDPLIIAQVIALFLITFVARTFYIPSSSMEPTLQRNDYILVVKFIYRFRQPQRQEIVVFHPPRKGETRDYIKRIIGLGGEVIEVKDGVVYINKKPLDEDYILEKPDYKLEPTEIPPGHFFVMGDNRNDSDDSHIWGTLPRNHVVGKAILIFWPPQRIRILK